MRILPTHLLIASAFAATSMLAQPVPQSIAPTPAAPASFKARPSFAAVTIKPHDPNDPCRGCSGFNTEGDRMKIRNKSVAGIMQVAYAIQPRQIAGAPDWFFSDTFDIVGATDTPGEITGPQWQSVLQNLLADRFALKFHHETRILPAYALQIVKGGVKIKLASPGEKANADDMRNDTDQTITATSSSIEDFRRRMQLFVDRPLVDQTGLTGTYDIALHYTIDESRTTDPNAPPGLFTAIEQQLGLKLQPTKAPIDVFVIDHIDHPTPN
jgi:uncharacterized protein (TIGR03435 family)